MAMKLFTLYLKEEQLKDIEELSKVLEQSKAATIRRAITQYVRASKSGMVARDLIEKKGLSPVIGEDYAIKDGMPF